MSFIVVNDTEASRGEVEVFQRLDLSEESKRIVYEGVFSCEKYFEQIDKIKTHRFVLDEVFVYQEKFSSEKDDILYYFTCNIFERVVENEDE